MGFKQLHPGIDSARYGNGMDIAARDRGQVLPLQTIAIGMARGAARPVKPFDPAVGPPDQGKTVAADAGHGWLGHAQHGGCRDRRIDGITAGPQYIDRRQGRSRCRCRRHAVCTESRRTAE